MESKIKVMGDLTRVNEGEIDVINKKLEKFVEKYDGSFQEMHLNVDFGLHKETSRGRAAHYIKLNIDSDKGRFHAENQDFGAEKTLTGALDKVGRQIDKQR